MQALERIEFSNNWLTLTFIFYIVLLFALKIINPQKLSAYSKAFFLKGFIEKKVEERASFFTGFNLVLYVFSVLIFALLLTLSLAHFSADIDATFQLYVKVILFSLLYFSAFFGLDIALSYLLETRGILAHIISAKTAYFYNSALFLFPFLVLVTYSSVNFYALLIVGLVLFVLSFVLTFINNKNLIISKLFYFILYICALKITPLLIIYKITV